MDEKTMIYDMLDSTKAELLTLQNMINEAENLELRQEIIQIRNNYESLAYELFKIAKLKEYYYEQEKATTKEIQDLKNKLQNWLG